MKLTKNFYLREFEKSQYAARKGIDNSIPAGAVQKLKELCMRVLQPVRNHFRRSVHINSGYRCPKLNKAIGGSPSSQHKKGEAADIEIAGINNLTLARWIRENVIFDQLILEHHVLNEPNSGWVHVSYKAGYNRMQVLSKIRGRKGYVPGLVVEKKRR